MKALPVLRRRLLHVLSLLLVCFAFQPAMMHAAPTSATQRPNIIFILTDDLGYGDLGTFFQNARRAANDRHLPAHFTPNLDTMAAEGIRLTHHYCPAPVCAPSRASLLMGVNQGHANVRDNQFDKALEDNHTLASVLKQAGYATAAIGKWGLQGKPITKEPDWPAHPLNRGFDYYYGYIRHADGHEHYPKEGPHKMPKEVWDNRTEVSAGLDKCYTADLWTARAKKWIVDQRGAHADQPFFMYLAYDTPHATCELPTQAYPAGGGAKGGLQWLGTPGHMINTASGTIDSWEHPDYAKATWDDDNDPKTPEKPWPEVQRRYATSVRRIDDCVGDLMQLLRDLNIERDTLVVFSSDNGISNESYLEKQPLQPWFFSSFGPFDGIKRDCWEGGTRVATIARWPTHIPAKQVSALPSSLSDWLPTFAEAAGLVPPARCDGVSLLPTLMGQGQQRPPRVYVEYFHNAKTPDYPQFEAAHRDRVRHQMQALRLGDFVGVRYNIKSADDNFEIYDAVNDPKEKYNLGADPKYASLQKQFKETVLQIRRPDPEAKRPYDNALVPAVEVKSPQPGVHWEAYDGSFPWVPQVAGLQAKAAGDAKAIDLSVRPAAGDGAVRFTGYIDVPADGDYTFSLATDTGAEFRIHEATVIDADRGYTAGKTISGAIRLQKGKHPIALTYVHRGSAAPSLELKWSGPNLQEQTVPASVLFTSKDAR